MLPSFNKSLHLEYLATFLYFLPVSVESGLRVSHILSNQTKLNLLVVYFFYRLVFVSLTINLVLGKNIIAIVICTKVRLKNTLPTNMLIC